jgi:hypothetical protein
MFRQRITTAVIRLYTLLSFSTVIQRANLDTVISLLTIESYIGIARGGLYSLGFDNTSAV